MMIEIKIPSPGESITEVEIAQWLVNDGEFVEKDQEIAEIESEKATLTLIASESGVIKIKHKTGETVKVGEVACLINTEKQIKSETKKTITNSQSTTSITENTKPAAKNIKVNATPLALSMMEKHDIPVESVNTNNKKITKEDIVRILNKSKHTNEGIEKVKMSSLRRKLSERLVAVKNETAMLTTFNELDMSGIIKIRKQYKDRFIKRHNIKLGFMSFFTKAVSLAIEQFPVINASIEKDEIIFHKFNNIGFAVQTDKGLMVPVLKNVETLNMAEIEIRIFELAEKARNKKISIEELSGGTFTITNGGVFGSMLSTPIINPPQSAILGMHNIIERPVAINGKVEIRPIMYLALSYDHRLIDGRDSVGFLVKVKELLENPLNMLMNENPEKELML